MNIVLEPEGSDQPTSWIETETGLQGAIAYDKDGDYIPKLPSGQQWPQYLYIAVKTAIERRRSEVKKQRAPEPAG